MNRRDFQELARVRLDEARTLLAAGRFDGSYYLSGYAVECALKACIAKKTRRYEFPPRAVGDMYTHDLPRLIRAAGLDKALEQAVAADNEFADRWTTAQKWSADSRYVRYTERQAQKLYDALTNRRTGVLRWVRRHW